MTTLRSVGGNRSDPAGELDPGKAPLPGAGAARELAAWIAKEGAAALAGPIDRTRVTPVAERRRVGERLRWVRCCAGFSRRELALLLALGDERSVEQRLYRYESGRAAVPVEVLQRTADILALSIEVFVAVDATAALAHTRLRRRRSGARRSDQAVAE